MYEGMVSHTVFITPEANKVIHEATDERINHAITAAIASEVKGISVEEACSKQEEVEPELKKGLGIDTLYCPRCKDQYGIKEPVGFIYHDDKRHQNRDLYCRRCGQKIKRIEVAEDD